MLRHYTDGEIPKDAEVLQCGFDTHGMKHLEDGTVKLGMLYCGMMVRGTWNDVPTDINGDPMKLIIYYEGQRVECFDEKGQPVRKRNIEVAKRQ